MGRTERFVPIFNFRYRDNATMLTVGGMIANTVDIVRLQQWGGAARFAYAQSSEQTDVAVPPLTTREKLALDKLFPTPATPLPADVAALGFVLKEPQIAAYHKYYGSYPVFGEMLP